MLIKLSITIEVDDLSDDSKEFPDQLTDDLDKLLSEMEDVCAKASVTNFIDDQEWEEV